MNTYISNVFCFFERTNKMSKKHGPFTYKDVIRFMGEQSTAEEGTDGLKMMDSVPAKMVLAAYGEAFNAIASDSAQSLVEKKHRMDDLFHSTLSGTQHMCAFILINHLWHDHFEL